MTTALLLDADTTFQTQEGVSEYRQQHPLQIAMCLRSLMQRHEHLNVECGGQQFLAQVLEVDSRNGTFTFTAGNVEADNVAVLMADQLTFRSVPGAIQTRFSTTGANKARFDNQPAFESYFPASLLHVQRREHFRVQTPVMEPFLALGSNKGGARFKLEIQDMSLGGVALRTHDVHFGTCEIGAILHAVELQLGHYGSLNVNLEVMSPRQLTTASGDIVYVLGCRYHERSSVAERLLQRVIMQLQCKR